MCRLVDAGRRVWTEFRRPFIWLPLVTWGTLTVFVHLMTPIAPVERFDVAKASWDLDKDRHQPGHFIPEMGVAAVSVDGAILVTAEKLVFVMRSWQRDCYRGPVRVWNLREGKLINEFATKAEYLRDFRLSPDGCWLTINGGAEICDVVSGRIFAFDRSQCDDVCRSNCGRWLAFWKENGLQFFDLHVQKGSSYQNSIQRVDKYTHYRRLHGFSDDDRWLIVETYLRTEERYLLWLDFDDGSIVKKVRIKGQVDEIKVSRDGKTLALPEYPGNLVVMDIAKEKRLLALRNPAWLGALRNPAWLGWDATQRNVIVFRDGPYPEAGDREPPRLESWSLETGQRSAVWYVPEPPKRTAGIYSFCLKPPAVPALSPDGSHIVWATFQEKDVIAPAWQAKLFSWLRRPPPPGFLYDVRLLNTKTFAEVDRWQIPVSDSNFYGTPPVIEWKPVGDRLFFSDGRQAEIWRVPPRMLSQSMGTALMLTWMLGVAWYLIRAWRTRKRATISPNDRRPFANVPEVSDART